jgi:DNA polymerase III subunit gamma/tau
MSGSYQVIARKYRPQRFGDVVGQEHVTQTLKHAIENGRIAHAYLFCGPRGTGKTTIARIFSMCLNCTGGPKPEFPDDDPKAREIAEGRSLDVLEIDGASNRGIEEIRELRETVKYAPASSKFKIYIIDEVHMLTKEAFNALLKTLEEPPAHVKFMFATTEPEKVLPTILSRCQRFDLRRIPIKLMIDHLRHIATLEKVEIDDAALFAVARGADGGMRDAESALDQLISFCGEKIVEADVLSMFGLTSQTQLLSLSGALLRGDVQTVLAEFNELAKHGKDLGKFLGDLLQHLRNLLIYNISRGDTRLLEVS